MKKAVILSLIILMTIPGLKSWAQQTIHVTGGAFLTVQNGASLYVNGGISLDDNAILSNSGIVTIGRLGADTADFTDQSAIPVNYGNGKFVFYGTGIQNIRGGIFQDLEINNASGVKLQCNVNVINNLNLISGNLYINNKTLTLSGPVTGTGKLRGSLLSNLNILGPVGTLNFDQADSASRSLKDLTLSGAATAATLGNALQLYGQLEVQGCTFHLNDQSLVLKSTGNGFSGTARVGNLSGSTVDGATNVTVERFIDNPKRSWHLLSARAVTGTQTIKQAWQENGGPIIAGQGTLVTSNLFNGTNGYDMASISASVLIHNQGGFAGPSWDYNLSNTNTTILSSRPGYMVFVRGDRNYTPANAPSTSSTVLRTNGTLTQGNQSAFISSSGTGRTLVANPYACPIDMEPVFNSTANLAQDMYIWDPSLTGNFGVGGYRVVERTGQETYQQTPVVLGGGAQSDPAARYIHSGQAFFLRTTGTTGTTDATVSFTENMKALSVSTVNPIVTNGQEQQLLANLLVLNPDSTNYLSDGFRIRFDSSYQNAITDDIEKMGNFNENISSLRAGKKLIVEKRPLIGLRDTIFIRLGNTGIKNYRFQIGTLFFTQPGVVAYLEDVYSNSRRPLDLSGSVNEIDFNITADLPSANPDRFRIVFTSAATLPVSFTRVRAARQNDHILVEWKVSQEQDIKHYTVERSADGINFSWLGIVNANGNTNGMNDYSWKDLSPINGDNFYRILSTGLSGALKMSETVKVAFENTGSGLVVYPNPVIGQKIQLSATGLAKGIYQFEMYNAIGQRVLTSSIYHPGGNGILLIPTGSVPVGRYFLKIIRPDRSVLKRDLLIAE